MKYQKVKPPLSITSNKMIWNILFDVIDRKKLLRFKKTYN